MDRGHDRRGAFEIAPQPVVSIIVPSRDRRALLERKLLMLESEPLNFEVIVVADACTDDTEKFLAAYSPPYHFSWTTGPGLHAASARNIGAARARGQILLFSDDDAIPTRGWVEENRRLHDKQGMVGLSRHVLPPHLKAGDTLKAVHGWWNTNGRSTSLRRELFEEVGGYDIRYSTYGGEDPDLGWRLHKLGAKFKFLSGSPIEHWDEGYSTDRAEKGESAGTAHVKVWHKYNDPKIAWALGVHPVMLAVKKVMLGPWARLVLGAEQHEFELAYAQGASAELRRARAKR